MEPVGGGRARKSCLGKARHYLRTRWRSQLSHEMRTEYAMELKQDSIFNRRAIGVANLMPRSPRKAELRCPRSHLQGVFESSDITSVLAPRMGSTNECPGWRAVSLPFTNTTRPIAATRAHRPPFLPTSTAFRKARLSICNQALLLAAYARAPQCKTYARRVSIRLPDTLSPLTLELSLAVIICCSLTLLRHLYHTPLISPRAAAYQAFSEHQKPCSTRPHSFFHSLQSLPSLRLTHIHRNEQPVDRKQSTAKAYKSTEIVRT